jgi:multiple sugar transport system permease protein
MADIVAAGRNGARRPDGHCAARCNFITPFVLIKSLGQMTLPGRDPGGASLSVIMAATVMAVLPLFVVFLVAQRFIIEGLTMTGIKG